MPAPPPDGRDRRWVPRVLVTAFSLLIFLVMASATVLSLWQRRVDTLADAARTTANLTRAFEEQALRTVHGIDLELGMLVPRIRDHLKDSAAASSTLREVLGREIAPATRLGRLAVFDAQDRPLFDSAAPGSALPEVDFAAAHQRGQAGGLAVQPIVRPDGEILLAFNRTVGDGAGETVATVWSFAGLDRLRSFYASLDIGNNASVALWDTEHDRLLARLPDVPGQIGRSLDGTKLAEALRGGAESGTFRTVSAVLDGVDRIASFRRIGNLPLVVLVSLGTAEVTAGWRRDAWIYGACVGLVATMLLLLAGVLVRQFSRQEALVKALSRSEAAAQLLNRRFEDAIDSLSGSFSLFDAEDRLVIGNRVHTVFAGASSGITFESLLRHAVGQLLDPAALGEDPEAWIAWRLDRHRNPQGPLEMRYRDGRWVRIEETRTRDGGIVVIRADITGLKNVEAALRASEQRFRDYAETASEWYWETDQEHRISYISGRKPPPSVVRRNTIEVDPPNPLGKRRQEIALDCAAEPQKWREHEAVLAAHQPFSDFVYTLATASGRLRHCSISGKPIFNAEGEFRGYRGTGRDVTEQILAESGLREAKAAAEAASRAKSEFLAAMSHELRTPLNAILGFSELIGSERYAKDRGQVRTYAADIHASGQHLLKVINEILELSRIEAGKLELRDELVEVAGVVDTCFTLIAQRAAESGIALERELPPDLPRLKADETRTKQILLNLLSNAVKFTPRGGTVTVAARLVPGDGLIIAVRDTGIGMSDDDIVVALQPFRQVESSLSRRYEGTGLGLPLAQAFAELHGGRLKVKSAPGIGTTVEVSFPASRVVEPPQPVAAAS